MIFDRALAAVGRMMGFRKVSPERFPDVRFVWMGNTAVKIHQPEDVLKVSTAWRCVTLKAETTAALHWAVRQRQSDGTTVDRADSPIQWLINHEPNPEMGSFDFRRTLTQHQLLYGNGYAEIARDARGRPAALWPIPPDRIEPQRTESGELYYRVSNPQGGFAELTPRDVYHVRGMGWDGVRGYGVLEVARQSMTGAAAMDTTASTFFANGMMPSGVVSVPRETQLSAEGFTALEGKIREKHRGPNNAGTPLILDGGMTYEQISTNPEQAQFLDTRKFSVYDVCRWFGVPPYLAFASDEQPRANVETQSREFYSYGLMPIIIAWEQEANRKLLTSEFGGLFTKMNTDELLRGDYSTLATYYQTMRSIGVFTINDVLRMEGMDTIGAEGDVRHMQMQNQPVSGAGETEPTEPDDDGGEGDENG